MRNFEHTLLKKLVVNDIFFCKLAKCQKIKQKRILGQISLNSDGNANSDRWFRKRVSFVVEGRSQKVWNGFWIVSVHRLHSSKNFSNTTCRTGPNQHSFIKKWWKLVTIINYRIVKNTNVNRIYFISFSQIKKIHCTVYEKIILQSIDAKIFNRAL